jgi:3-oxoacyl-(acyl-carrier-protein) synthase
VVGTSRRARVRAALSNSFGFGGHNAVIAMTEVER